VGDVVPALEAAGLEARKVELLRAYDVLTQRAWLANLESDWDTAVALVGAATARVWRLPVAGAAPAFEEGAPVCPVGGATCGAGE